ncbi:alpha/beta hydrolase [Nostoc parmelioides]|uniref:Alpha/beta hydrolase n=1 Tax=Nostoc parmelioides FACHB-3921 TaxID=2692909 RepID=A0ABR8BH99_9NOSO|nr:alpha/beta hydrolase [Nostoc parmelioides]MBD2253325.1 alpha/beta hydrolase [Nostoc parmelioides FACHB-3921]
MTSLNLERVIEAMFAIWHELPELLNERWESFETDLFEFLKTNAANKTNDQVAQEILEKFGKYEQALALLDSKYQELSPKNYEAGSVSAEYEIIPVYFATPRHYDSSKSLDQQFTEVRGDGSLNYGVAEVSIPPDRRMGSINQPPFWRSEDIDRDMTIYSLTKLSQSEFSAQANKAFSGGQQREGMVFVHGYNVTFKTALLRTGQLAYDLAFKGLPLLFSWTSTGHFMGYSADEENVRWSQQLRHFESFLEFCFNELKLDTIHLVAHSMGNRILTQTLTQIINVQTKGKLGQVVFAAPDVDAGTFKHLAASFPSNAARYTLYTSKHDLAVRLSEFLHGSYPRAGKFKDENDVVIVNPVETLDASNRRNDFVGHSYFSDNKSIVSDIFHLFKNNLSPDDRFGLKGRTLQCGKMWIFSKL